MPTKKVFMLFLNKSKTAALLLMCFSPTFFLSNKAIGQGTTKPVYISVNYVKTQMGKQGAYLDLLKNYTKKIYEYNFKQGRSVGTYVSSMVLPAGSSAEYDITIINVSTELKYLVDDSVTAKEILKKIKSGIFRWFFGIHIRSIPPGANLGEKRNIFSICRN